MKRFLVLYLVRPGVVRCRVGRTHAVVVHHVVLELWQGVGVALVLADVHGRQRLGSTQETVVKPTEQVSLKKRLLYCFGIIS